MIEGGGIFHGSHWSDRLRTEVYLKALGKMGYHAIAMGREEFTFGTEFLKDQIGASKIPFLSANAYVGEAKEPLGRPYVIRELGRVKVAILGLTAPPVKKSPVPHGDREPVQAGESAFEVADPLLKARENLAILKGKVDLIIVVSDLPEKENTALAAESGAVDVILATRGKVPAENVSGGTVIVTPRSGYLARLDLYVSSEGRPLRHEIDWIHLSEDIASDPEIKQFISRSFAEVAKDKGVQPAGRQKPSDERLNQEGDNGYAGAESCLGCHEKEYRAWKRTRHAWAFETLTQAQSQGSPDCFSCHTTGSGPRQPMGRLRGVQCEACHGPGKEHIIHPQVSRLRDDVPVSVCTECHNKDITPTLEQQKEIFFGKIRHDGRAQKGISPSMHPRRAEVEPNIAVSEEVWDFGTISQGGNVSRKFQVSNTGKGTLKIEKVWSSSDRTAAKVVSHTVAPGENTEMEVTFRPGGSLGKVVQYVFIGSNDPDEPHKKITLTGYIKHAQPR